MYDIVIYSTGCPRCQVLKKKLTQIGLTYTEETDTNVMVALGMKFAPGMRVNNGEIMNFNQAVHWIKGHQNG